jgi:hypothetical protein
VGSLLLSRGFPDPLVFLLRRADGGVNWEHSFLGCSDSKGEPYKSWVLWSPVTSSKGTGLRSFRSSMSYLQYPFFSIKITAVKYLMLLLAFASPAFSQTPARNFKVDCTTMLSAGCKSYNEMIEAKDKDLLSAVGYSNGSCVSGRQKMSST